MFAERLKTLRETVELTQKELAKILDVAVGTVGMWEIGKREPSFNTVNQIANFFHVSTDYLLGHEEKQEKPTPVSGDGLSEEQLEVIRRYEAAPPALRAAALAVLRSAEEQDKVQGDGPAGE